MFLFQNIRTAIIVLTIGMLVFAATDALAAGAPMSAAQLALYQGSDRDGHLMGSNPELDS